MKTGEQIKKLRKSLKLSQAAFGEIFGVKQNVISDIEKGKSNPSNTLVAYLKYRYGDIFKDKKNNVPFFAESDPFTLPHSIIIESFQQKRLARDINFDLLKLEAIEPKALHEISEYVKFKINRYDRRSGADRRKEDIPELAPEDDRRSGIERRVAGLNS